MKHYKIKIGLSDPMLKNGGMVTEFIELESDDSYEFNITASSLGKRTRECTKDLINVLMDENLMDTEIMEHNLNRENTKLVKRLIETTEIPGYKIKLVDIKIIE